MLAQQSVFNKSPRWHCCILKFENDYCGEALPSLGFSREVLEWVAITFSNAWNWKVKVKLLSCVWLPTSPWTAACQAPPSMGLSRQKYWSGLPLPSPCHYGEGRNRQCPCYQAVPMFLLTVKPPPASLALIYSSCNHSLRSSFIFHSSSPSFQKYSLTN